MITEGILLVLFRIGEFLVGLLPDFDLSTSSGGMGKILSVALYLFPSDVWVLGIGNIVVMCGIAVGWSIVEWVYKKIPGVD